MHQSYLPTMSIHSCNTQAIGSDGVVGDVFSHKVEENSKVNEARNSEGSILNQI